MKKHICFITPGHIASNPRLVKEAEVSSKTGYKVTIVMSQYLTSLQAVDEDIFEKNPDWNKVIVKWTGNSIKEKWLRFYTKVREYILKYLSVKFSITIAGGNLLSRVCTEQIVLAKKNKADLYIAHNLGALPVAAEAAKYHHVKYAFDAEDYHRGQLEIQEGFEYELIKAIEDKYLPKASYITGASPLISKKYIELYPQHKKVTTINNVFSRKGQLKHNINKQNNALKLFWFSQTVGPDRGLEDVIKAMGKTKNKNIYLTLLGGINANNKNYFNKLIKEAGLNIEQIEYMNTVSPEMVFTISIQHDIGLALEVAHSENRDICLTNKIFTYLIAGNAIVTSETTAQKKFMETYPSIGKTFPLNDTESLSKILLLFYNNKELLSACKTAAWNLGQEELNWEKESEKFLGLVKNVI